VYRARFFCRCIADCKRSAVVAQLTVERLYTLHGAAIPPPKKMPIPLGTGTYIYHMAPWAHQSQHPKRHLDGFSRFCRTHERDQQTDTHKDRLTDTHRPTTLLRVQQ